ncbi:MAG: 1-(5-phosphoribosyl)-5-[(5-phosphoribosylamino)methylideneamino]imidazole-4-carboxamide isomerase [Chloroflexi bacterium]|nr:1-(5-phosphoribosyl)-5-[(5-phosphoribosylamino)methylideneamino]imidazole-4-carboxamide isomerase [Chloroflexota bacterium]
MFTIYPAIDLRGGRVVRLKQGRAESEIAYSDDPAATARRWEREGAMWLHVVNLDGAFGENNVLNTVALKNILAAVQIPVQFGGGLRDVDAMRRALDLGVKRVILGTVAIEHPDIVRQAIDAFGAERVALAIDAREGIVATRGWVQGSGIQALEFGKQMRALGIPRAIVTDIARDGMLRGIDAAAMAEFARVTGLRVIASGGVASLDDIKNLRRVEATGVEGLIVGQALYTGAVELREAMAVISDQ